MTILLIASLLAGISAGLRAFTPLAVVSWAAAAGSPAVDGTVLWFMGATWAPYVFTILAVVEYVTDQLPSTPSRTVPMQFGARLLSGALCGATLGIASGGVLPAIVAGLAGAVAGTLGGYHARRRLVAAIGGRDLPIALAEDVLAIVVAFAAVRMLG